MNKESKMLFSKINYQLLVLGILVLITGFFIMSIHTGENLTEEEKYSFLSITLSPIIILLGYTILIISIFARTKKANG